MEVGVLNMNKLFGKDIRYEIPTFQRPYVWNKEEQWQPLWDDVRNTAEEYLEQEKPLKQARTHFLGAVVVQQLLFSSGEIETRLVVDGQQRLTTLQLLLDGVQEVVENLGFERIAKRMSLLVLNNDAFVDDEDDVFKVWPTLSDRCAFRHAMHNSLASDNYQDSLIVQAHEFFKLQVEQWLDERQGEGEARADALEKAVRHLLELVVIDLSIDDEPHIIFETLNARGTPLLQSDLIKNIVLFEATKRNLASDSKGASRLWGFSDEWWRVEVGRGRNREPRVDVFLNYWLTMRTQEEIRPDSTSAEFREYIVSAAVPIENIAEDISRVSETYRAIEEGSKKGYESFLYRREVMQAGALTPVLLWLFSTEMPEEQRIKAFRALDSYMVRRMICQRSTKNYPQLFLGLVSRLEESVTANAGEVVSDYLANQTAYANLWPDDRTLEEAFQAVPLYWSLTQGRIRFVLEGLEEELRSNMAETQVAPRGLTIEHILPQKWQENYPLPADTRDVEAAVEMRENRNRIIHSIGNLTLVNGRLNASLSNARWAKKQKTLGKHTVLFLNKELLAVKPTVWNEEMILKRAERLSKVATRVWPSAKQLEKP